jgi:hypothetical protein
MRSNSENSRISGALLISSRWSVQRLTLTTDVVVSEEGPLMHFLDPGGDDRDIWLPELKTGCVYVVHHVGTDNTLSIRDNEGVLLTTLNNRQSAECTSSGQEWNCTRTWDDVDVFVGAGPGHSLGLVPDPGPVAQALRFLREDGVWAEAMDDGNVDAFKFVTDGSTIATANGGDTLRLRSSDGTLDIIVQNNDGTFGDNVNFAVVESAVDHDALLNFVADEHVAHTGVTIEGLTNGGLGGGGNIAASRTLSIAPINLTAATPVLGDIAIIGDVSDSNAPKRTTFTDLNAIFVHNNLTGYEADRHVDHSLVSVVAGVGLSGGGPITSSVTLELDLDTIPSGTINGDDLILFDDAVSGVYKATFLGFNQALDHDVLINYSANEHIDHTAVSISPGTGLSGGGTIAATRTLELNAASIASLAKADSALQAAAIGVSIQAYDADLTTWAGLTPSANHQTLVTQTFAQMRASLDLEAGTDFYSIAGANAAFEPINSNILKSNVTADLSAGFTSTAENAGTKTTGTFTPDPTVGNFQRAVNGGAHTLAPPTNDCSILIQYTNNASAGAITTSGFTKKTGDTITTTNGDDFFFFVTKCNGFSHLHVQALQ